MKETFDVSRWETWFQLKERGTTWTTEILAGCTTFMTMVFILVVNPAILSDAGMDFNGVYVATVLVTLISTLIIALFGNFPFVIAPGMGINAFFAYSVVKAQGIPWQTALGSVFLAGTVFLVLALTRYRRFLLDAIPQSLKYAITAGTGLFICFVGLQNAKLVISSPDTLVTLGNLREPGTLLSIIGLAVTLLLMTYRIRGALFLGMIVTSVLAWIMGLMQLPSHFLSIPSGLAHTALQLDIDGVFNHGMLAVTFTFLLISVFETTGTMVSLAEQAGLMKEGRFPHSRSALLANAVGVTSGALLGTSPITTLVESGSGIAAGGRTGLTPIVTCILLVITMFFAPVAETLASTPFVTAPALVIVGFSMLEEMVHVEWKSFEEAFPSFLVMVTMPLTYSVSSAIGIGFIVYVLLKLFRGKAKEVHPALYFFALFFFIQLGFIHS